MPNLPGNNMKTISPISVWWNGSLHSGTVLSLICNNDNLYNQANFNYNIFTRTEEGFINISIAQGHLTMTGEDYDAWVTNDHAYEWAAAQLNLTITGNYEPPTPVPAQ